MDEIIKIGSNSFNTSRKEGRGAFKRYLQSLVRKHIEKSGMTRGMNYFIIGNGKEIIAVLKKYDDASLLCEALSVASPLYSFVVLTFVNSVGEVDDFFINYKKRGTNTSNHLKAYSTHGA